MLSPRPFLILLLYMMPAFAADDPTMDVETFEHRLALAEELNVTRPWRVSQQVLDELRPHLGLASADQYARFILLEIRNLILAGRVEESLALVADLLQHDMSDRLRLKTLTRGTNVALIGRRFTPAFTYLNQALAMLDQPRLRAVGDDVYNLAANIYSLVGENELAVRYGRLALDISREREPRDICYAGTQLGLAYLRRGDYDRARTQYTETLEACRESGEGLAIAIAAYRLADLLRRDGRYQRSEQLFRSATEGLEKAGYAYGLAEARLYHARLARQLGQSERVEALLAPAMEQLRDDENWQKFAEGQRLLAEVARERGDSEDAMAHYDQLLAARERYMERLRDRQTAFLQVQFDTSHTEQQLRLLRERERVRELEMKTREQQQRMRFGALLLIVALIAVLIVLLARALRDRRRFESLSQRDALTALSNHTRFFELAEQTMLLSRQKGVPYTFVLADIDHFKRVNDRHGHQAGDVVLRRVAARLREHFSSRGIIGRIGGEEFGIALPGITPERAEVMLQTFRRSLNALRDDDHAVDVTLSFGLAAPRDDDTIATVRERADRALYEAKRAGRDRIVHARDRMG